MSHYAKVGIRPAFIVVNGSQTQVEGGLVDQVIVAEADFFKTFVDTSPGQWIQTSYNTRGNLHYGADGKPDGGVALRGNYAGIDGIYDVKNDKFYAAQPFPSWVLNPSTWLWEAPVPMPTTTLPENEYYAWNESTKAWVVQTIPA